MPEEAYDVVPQTDDDSAHAYLTEASIEEATEALQEAEERYDGISFGIVASTGEREMTTHRKSVVGR